MAIIQPSKRQHASAFDDVDHGDDASKLILENISKDIAKLSDKLEQDIITEVTHLERKITDNISRALNAQTNIVERSLKSTPEKVKTGTVPQTITPKVSMTYTEALAKSPTPVDAIITVTLNEDDLDETAKQIQSLRTDQMTKTIQIKSIPHGSMDKKKNLKQK